MEYINDGKIDQQSNEAGNPDQNFSGMSPQNSNRNLKILVGVLISLLVIGAGAVVFYIFGNKTVSKNEQPNLTSSQSASPIAETSTSEHVPVIIYAQDVKFTESGYGSRSWPTVKIMRKTGNAEPEALVEVGKIGEFPSSYQLSPDNRFLLINLESKLQILNLATKELKDLFVPKRQVLSMSYSPDGKQLFIWDQRYAPTDGDNSYYVHLFTIANQQDQILAHGTNANSFFGKIWRDDNKVILFEAQGELSALNYFDLANNQVLKTSGNFAAGLLSQSGKIMAAVRDSVGDVCNDMSSSAPGIINVINPVSGKILGTIDGLGNIISVLAFSPDDEKALYVAEKPWTNREDCNEKAETSYYEVQIATGQSTKLSNPSDVLMSWNENFINAHSDVTTDYGSNKSTWLILIGDQVIITSDKGLQIVGQFYN